MQPRFFSSISDGKEESVLASWYALPADTAASLLDCTPTQRAAFKRMLRAVGADTLRDFLLQSDPDVIAAVHVGPTHHRILAGSLGRALRKWQASLPPQPGAPTAWKPAPPPPPPPPADPLVGWAEEHGVADRLETYAGDLPPGMLGWQEVPRFLRRVGVQRTLRDLLDERTATGLSKLGRDEARRGIERWLSAEAKSAERLREEDAVEQRPLADDAEFHELDMVFAAALERAPARRPGPRTPIAVTFTSDPPSLRWQRSDLRTQLGLQGFCDFPQFAIELRRWRLGAEEFSKCHADGLRAARRLLRTPESPDHQALLEWLREPEWKRMLRAFDRLREAAMRPLPEDATPERLAFRVRGQGANHVVPIIQKVTKKGVWSKGAEAGRMRYRELLDRADALDRPVVEAMLADIEGSWEHDGLQRRFARVLSALVGHPRVFLDDGPALVRRTAAAIELVETPLGLVPRIRIGEALREVHQLAVRTADGTLVDLDSAHGHVSLGTLPRAAAGFLSVYETHPAAFPRESWDALVSRLELLGADLPLRLPEVLEGPALDAPIVSRLRFELDAFGALTVRVLAHIQGRDGDLVPGEGAERIYLTQDGTRCHVARDFAAEKATAHALIEQLGLASRGRAVDEFGLEWVIAKGDDVLAVVEDADKLGQGVDTRWAAERVRVVGPFNSNKLRVRVRSAGEFLFVGGDITVDETRVSLAAIATALRNGSRFVSIGKGRFARIAESLRDRLLPVVDLGSDAKDGLEVSPAALPFVAMLLDETAKADTAPEFRARLSAWRDVQDRPILPAKHLRKVLRSYQREGFQWLARLAAWGAGAVLADDMGLGKTIQAIAILETRRGFGPALVIAPTSVGPNWERELERFGATLNVRPLRGPNRGALLEGLDAGDVLIASWDVAVRDKEALAAIRFSTIVFDEAQAAKNASTRRAAMARALQADFRVALTGTPIENHLGELWSLFSFISPGFLGSWDRFRERFAVPIEREGDDAKRRALARFLRPFVLRRTKEAVEKDLPALTETTRWIDLSPNERALYEATRREAIGDLEGRVNSKKDHLLFLAWLTRLRQIACHPKLFAPESTVPSSKLRAFMALIDELREARHRALVFSQFTQHLALVRQALDQKRVPYLYLDGSTTVPERARRVDAFQAGEGDLFLISLKAGGMGINLTAATHVIHLDPWWNPAVEDQATDRAHRIGQTKPVTVVKLIARGTIEEAIVAMREEKRALAEAVLAGTEAAGRLSASELLELVRSGVGSDSGEDVEEGDEG